MQPRLYETLHPLQRSLARPGYPGHRALGITASKHSSNSKPPRDHSDLWCDEHLQVLSDRVKRVRQPEPKAAETGLLPGAPARYSLLSGGSPALHFARRSAPACQMLMSS